MGDNLNMGDNMVLRLSKDDLGNHAQKMREQTESTISILEKLFHFSDGLCKRTQKLEEEVSSAIQSRGKTEESLAASQKEIQSLQGTVDELEARINDLNTTLAHKDAVFQQILDEKDRKIAELNEAIQKQEALMIGLKYLRQNVDAFRLGDRIIEEPCGACMLPDGCVVVADTLKGLLLFSSNTELIRQVTSEDWKWPQGLVYDSQNGVLVVTMVKRTTGDQFERVIARFSLKLEFLDCIPGPDDAKFDNITKERLALGPCGDMYLILTDKISSALYKYMSKQWFLLSARQGASFIDLQVLASTGPITEILVVESKMGYVHKIAVKGADIADRRSLAVVEKPGALCVDNEGQLFVQDVISGKIRQIDRVKFEPVRDICIVDDAVFSITAGHGYLGVAGREAKSVRIFRYSKSAITL